MNGWILLAIKVKASNAEGTSNVDEESCVTFLLCDPGWYAHKPDDVQNKWDDNAHIHTHIILLIIDMVGVRSLIVKNPTPKQTNEETHTIHVLYLI